jgi:hypothetical protein
MTAVAADDVEAYAIEYKDFIPLIEEEPALKLALVTDVAEFLGAVSVDNERGFSAKENLLKAWMQSLGDLAKCMGEELLLEHQSSQKRASVEGDSQYHLRMSECSMVVNEAESLDKEKGATANAIAPASTPAATDGATAAEVPATTVGSLPLGGGESSARRSAAARQAKNIKQQVFADLFNQFADNWSLLMGGVPNPLSKEGSPKHVRGNELFSFAAAEEEGRHEELFSSTSEPKPSDRSHDERKTGEVYCHLSSQQASFDLRSAQSLTDASDSRKRFMYEEITASLRSVRDDHVDASSSMKSSAVADSHGGEWIAETVDFKGQAPMAVWIGNLMDGVAEAIVIGAQVRHLLASASNPSNIASIIPYTLIASLCIANFPEAMAASMTMYQYGWSKARCVLMWLALTSVIGLGSGLGYLMAAVVPEMVVIAVEGFATGGMLVMIAANMIPEAVHLCGPTAAGLVLLCGFTASYMFELLQA